MRVVSMLSGQLRFQRENLVLLAKSAVDPPAAATWVKTDSTRSPAAAWTVDGRRRSSFHVTPCPPVRAAIRRPVTIPVWLGRVIVCSCSVRALRVEAPDAIRSCRWGVRLGPSLRSASVLRPSTEIATTESIASSAERRSATRSDTWSATRSGTWAVAEVRQSPTTEQARTDASTERRVTVRP
jgi:hypothetical protein